MKFLWFDFPPKPATPTCVGYFTNHDGDRVRCRNHRHGHPEPILDTTNGETTHA